MHTVSETELDTVASLSGSVHLAFLGVSLGAFITLLITVLTVPLQEPKTFAAFVACTGLAGILAIYFGIYAAIDYKAAKAKLQAIKRSEP